MIYTITFFLLNIRFDKIGYWQHPNRSQKLITFSKEHSLKILSATSVPAKIKLLPLLISFFSSIYNNQILRICTFSVEDAEQIRKIIKQFIKSEYLPYHLHHFSSDTSLLQSFTVQNSIEYVPWEALMIKVHDMNRSHQKRMNDTNDNNSEIQTGEYNDDNESEYQEEIEEEMEYENTEEKSLSHASSTMNNLTTQNKEDKQIIIVSDDTTDSSSSSSHNMLRHSFLFPSNPLASTDQAFTNTNAQLNHSSNESQEQ